jgi:arylsulfatase A-like enzyme
MTPKTKILSVLYALLVLFVLPQKSPASQPQKKYNVLFLFADDQRKDTIAALGNKHIKTPNLDKLLKSGTYFSRAYIQGSMSGAVCMPSRAMLMSGRTLFRAPMDLKGVPLLGEVLAKAGYTTVGIGKWHNGADSLLRSFQIGPANYLGGMSDHFDVPLSHITENRKVKRIDDKGKHSSEIYADAAIDFLKNKVAKKQLDGKPFFMYIAFQAPHDPRDAPKKYLDMYYKDRPPLPKNFMPQHPFDNGHMVLRDENLAAWPRTENVIRDQLAEYYGLITHLDEQVGRILQALAESGELENTIIIYTADHGLAMGSHGLLGKQSIYDHSVGTPLIFAGPGIPKNEQRDAMVYLLDLFPTICDMNGVAIPDSVEGKSLAKIITGEQKKVRDDLYFNYRHLMRGMRDEQYHLICYPPINHVQLFDLKNDPDELKNLAYDPKFAKRVEEMKTRTLAWEKELGLKPMPLTVASPKPKEINLTGTARKPDQWQPQWIRKKYFDE